MGAGAAGNFGHTKGSIDLKSFLDTLSGLLAIASLIPVADTAIDIAALLVDLLRGDYVSAALDLAGVIPFVGEAADTARIAKVTDKTIDAVKTAKKVDKAVDTAKVAKKTSKISSVADNAKSVAKKYTLSKSGYFGTKGKNTRVFKSDDPIKSSADSYRKISKGGKHSPLSNGKGVQTIFEDGSRVIYRVKTSTPNSPAVDISISIYSGIKKQKIHFIK